MNFVRHKTVVAASVAAADSVAAVDGGRGGFGGRQGGGPGGPGGPNAKDQLLVEKFDADADGRLNTEERAEARKSLNQSMLLDVGLWPPRVAQAGGAESRSKGNLDLVLSRVR